MATPTGPRPKRIRPIEMAGEAPFWAVVRHLPEDEPTASRKDAQPVLLVHAATLGRRMFLVPDGGFVGYLLGQRDGDGAPRFDVFTLDWRSSNLLFGDGAQGGEGKNREDYRLDEIIDVDVVEGVKAVAKLHPGVPLHIVAHCMGAALTAQAIAEEKIGLPGATPLGHVVLATVGLCYRLGVDGWLKVSDNIMRDIEHSHPGLMGVSPHVVYDPEKLAGRPSSRRCSTSGATASSRTNARSRSAIASGSFSGGLPHGRHAPHARGQRPPPTLRRNPDRTLPPHHRQLPARLGRALEGSPAGPGQERAPVQGSGDDPHHRQREPGVAPGLD